MFDEEKITEKAQLISGESASSEIIAPVVGAGHMKLL